MDSDEEAGLRAFGVTVGAEGGEDTLVRPLWLAREAGRVPVVAIDSSWREEERFGFRVLLGDGSRWLLYYVPELELWSGIADAGHAGSEQR